MTDWEPLRTALRREDCAGVGPIQILSKEDFYDEETLPFELEGGSILRVIPEQGFRKENLAGSEDEHLMIVDCPDEDGWLVPSDIVGDWLNRHISSEPLEDLLLSHPLYEYLTAPDEDGMSRGGHRGERIHWAPGVPNLASIYAPEFLPDDADAPPVNRVRDRYADAVVDLLRRLEADFDLYDVEVGLRYGPGFPFDEEE